MSSIGTLIRIYSYFFIYYITVIVIVAIIIVNIPQYEFTVTHPQNPF